MVIGAPTETTVASGASPSIESGAGLDPTILVFGSRAQIELVSALRVPLYRIRSRTDSTLRVPVPPIQPTQPEP